MKAIENAAIDFFREPCPKWNGGQPCGNSGMDRIKMVWYSHLYVLYSPFLRAHVKTNFGLSEQVEITEVPALIKGY